MSRVAFPFLHLHTAPKCVFLCLAQHPNCFQTQLSHFVRIRSSSARATTMGAFTTEKKSDSLNGSNDPEVLAPRDANEVTCPEHTTERRLMTKIDGRVIPFLCVMYLLAFLGMSLLVHLAACCRVANRSSLPPQTESTSRTRTSMDYPRNWVSSATKTLIV